MKLAQLHHIVTYMQRFTQCMQVYRIGEKSIRIVWDREHAWDIHLRAGASTIVLAPTTQRGAYYNAPLDILLAKRLNRAKIEKIELYRGDKILRIHTVLHGSYKHERSILHIEMTGKHTNLILLDTDEIVLEALRHIDESTSTRSVRVGERLMDPPPPPYHATPIEMEDVEGFLREHSHHYYAQEMARLREQKYRLIDRQATQIQHLYDTLEDERYLREEAAQAQHAGEVIFARLYSIDPYARPMVLEDFDGTWLTLDPPQGGESLSQWGQGFFTRAKKLRQKAQGLHQEEHHLSEKRLYLARLRTIIESAHTPEQIALLFPTRSPKERAQSDDAIHEMWIDGIKISIGKNERGNIALLKRAKAKDIWLHLKDRPSAHVIISTNKEHLPQTLLEQAARWCVDFSTTGSGRYEVDYTPRREVRIIEKAHVLYNHYKTLTIVK